MRPARPKITLFYGQLNPEFEYHWLPLTYSLLCAYLDFDKVEVAVIDERIEKDKTPELIKRHVPESLFFGISSFTGFQLSRSVKMARYVKEEFPRVPIIWGGAHVTALPEQSLKEDFVDMVVVNRAEKVLPKLIETLRKNNLSNIEGVYFKNGKDISGRPNLDIPDFGLTPPWPYELVEIDRYLNPKTMVLNLTTSWGCSNRCSFCYWYRNRNPWSCFDAERVFKTARYLKQRYKLRRFYFNDANYFLIPERSLDIANRLKELDVAYLTTARADDLSLFSPEQFRLLEESGLYAVFIGLESGSPRVLKLMNKNIDLEDLTLVAENSRNTGITLFLSLIFQVPDERIEDLKITHDYVEGLKKINPNIRVQTCSFTPLPNVPLTRLAERRGFKPPKDMEGWAGIDRNIRFEMKPWITEEFGREYEKVFNELFPESQRMVYD